MSDYYGRTTRVLESKYLHLEVLEQAGPRLVRLQLGDGGDNLLAELPELHWRVPRGEYHAYGGHRLWSAPETAERTYVPDDQGLTIEESPDGLLLIGAPDTGTGLRKRLTIRLDPQAAVVNLTHEIVNEGSETTEVAAWAITQLPLGGQIYLPQTTGPFPDQDSNAVYWPNRHVVFWNYARLNDPRLQLADDHLRLDAVPRLPPLKVGQLNTDGWAAYLRSGILFAKGFQPLAEQTHPDQNCNVEVYCSDSFIELETLGPLTSLAAGARLEHTERWEFMSGVQAAGFEDVRDLVIGRP
jgi:hypothetical protein